MTRTAGGGWIDRLGSDVHVWTIDVDASPTVLATCESMLSEDERRRAAAFRFEPSRFTFVLARGCLRALLGRYLEIEPAAIEFAYGAQGKPSISVPATMLEFNQSHSGKRALYALVSRSEIGIDVEQITKLDKIESIAGNFFSPQEVADLGAIPAASVERAFFATWTRKEAFIKALAQGLSFPLDRFRVTVDPDRAPRLEDLDGDAAAAQRWQMHTLDAGPGYTATLVYQGEPRSVRAFPLLRASELLELVETETVPGDL